VPRSTQDPNPLEAVTCTGLSPAPVGLSSAVPLPPAACCWSYNPAAVETAAVWAAPLSLATTHGILSFPPGTEMFQFPEFPA
jgi:hypothetical protein